MVDIVEERDEWKEPGLISEKKNRKGEVKKWLDELHPGKKHHKQNHGFIHEAFYTSQFNILGNALVRLLAQGQPRR